MKHPQTRDELDNSILAIHASMEKVATPRADRVMHELTLLQESIDPDFDLTAEDWIGALAHHGRIWREAEAILRERAGL